MMSIIPTLIFCITAVITIVMTTFLLLVRHPMHGAMCLIASLLGLAIEFYLLGSFLLAIFQVIIYVGAIMVLFVFFIMMYSSHMLSMKPRSSLWMPVGCLCVLILEGSFIVYKAPLLQEFSFKILAPDALGKVLFGNNPIIVELLSTLLLIALIIVIYLASPWLNRQEKNESSS